MDSHGWNAVANENSGCRFGFFVAGTTYNSIDKTVGLVHACGVRTWHCLWHFMKQSRHSYPCLPGRRGIERLHTSQVSPLENQNIAFYSKYLSLEWICGHWVCALTRSNVSLRKCDHCKCVIWCPCGAILAVVRLLRVPKSACNHKIMIILIEAISHRSHLSSRNIVLRIFRNESSARWTKFVLLTVWHHFLRFQEPM